jgi:hypothetical protein
VTEADWNDDGTVRESGDELLRLFVDEPDRTTIGSDEIATHVGDNRDPRIVVLLATDATGVFEDDVR